MVHQPAVYVYCKRNNVIKIQNSCQKQNQSRHSHAKSVSHAIHTPNQSRHSQQSSYFDMQNTKVKFNLSFLR